VPGNAPVDDIELARWAAHGNHSAFGMLFDRHLVAVYEAAWEVVQDPELAAEITRDTFVDAWDAIAELPAEAFVEQLLDLARHNAFAWLTANPGGPVDAPPLPAPSLGPGLRTRIVGSLDALGVPVRVKAQDGSGAPTGPPPAELVMSRWDPIVYRLSGLFARTGARVAGVAVLAVVVLAAGAVAVASRGGGGGADDTSLETASDVEPGNAADEPSSTTSTTASTTTTTTAPPTTTASSAAVRGTSTTTRPAPATSAPTTPPTTSRPTPATTATPSVPTILEFDGYTTGQGGCPAGNVNFVMHWKTVQATWIWVHTEGARWEDVDWSQRPDGSTSRCTTYGTKWYLEIRREGDWLEDTAITYV